jgi:hypothetical protein
MATYTAPTTGAATPHQGGPAIRRMRVWTIAGAALVVGTVSAAPGTLALWNDQADVQGIVVQSGTLDAAIAPGTASPTTATSAELAPRTGLLPGETRWVTFTVRNTGTVDLALRLALDDATVADANLEFSVTEGACSSQTPSGTELGSTPVPIGEPLPPATNLTLCAHVTLSEDAPASLQGTSVGTYTIVTTAGSTT